MIIGKSWHNPKWTGSEPSVLFCLDFNKSVPAEPSLNRGQKRIIVMSNEVSLEIRFSEDFTLTLIWCCLKPLAFKQTKKNKRFYSCFVLTIHQNKQDYFLSGPNGSWMLHINSFDFCLPWCLSVYHLLKQANQKYWFLSIVVTYTKSTLKFKKQCDWFQPSLKYKLNTRTVW